MTGYSESARRAGLPAELATDIGTYCSGASQSLAPANPRVARFMPL